jgi:hypothetical protein
MGNLNLRRAIGAARAAVRDEGGCLSRAARERFTADGLLAGRLTGTLQRRPFRDVRWTATICFKFRFNRGGPD